MIVVFAAIASQRGGEDGGGGPLNAIAEAAVKTQHEGGGRAAMRAVVTEPGRSEPFTIIGRVVYNADGVARGTATVPDSESSGSVKVEYVQDGTKMYMRSSRFGTLPEGRDWMGLDLSFGEGFDSSLPAGSDAKGELELLEQATGGVDKVGKENVRGVPTTRYRSTISPSESAKRWREEGAEKTASYAEKRGVPLRVEAWIDAAGLVRRMRVVQLRPEQAGEGPKSMDMRIDFFDFGFEPEIEVPDPSEVFDATSLTQEALEASSSE